MIILVNVFNPTKNPKLKAHQSTFLPKSKKNSIEIVKQIKLKSEMLGRTCDYKRYEPGITNITYSHKKLINRICTLSDHPRLG